MIEAVLSCPDCGIQLLPSRPQPPVMSARVRADKRWVFDCVLCGLRLSGTREQTELMYRFLVRIGQLNIYQPDPSAGRTIGNLGEFGKQRGALRKRASPVGRIVG